MVYWARDFLFNHTILSLKHLNFKYIFSYNINIIHRVKTYLLYNQKFDKNLQKLNKLLPAPPIPFQYNNYRTYTAFFFSKFFEKGGSDYTIKSLKILAEKFF